MEVDRLVGGIVSAVVEGVGARVVHVVVAAVIVAVIVSIVVSAVASPSVAVSPPAVAKATSSGSEEIEEERLGTPLAQSVSGKKRVHGEGQQIIPIAKLQRLF